VAEVAEFAVQRGKQRVVLYAPTAKQVLFHNAPERNVLYGGAAGGGKSHALRWDAYIRCLTVGNYRALLLRRTYPELESTHLDGVPVDIANGLPAQYLKSDRKVLFGNGSVLRFGHCEDDASLSKYLSTEYDAIYFDELVTFTEKQFLLVRSRARSTKPGVKPVIRAGTNPGGPESHWVRRRFIWQDTTPKEDPRYRPVDYRYIPATLDDNPHLDQAEYAANLESLPEELARAYRFGDWDIFPGQYFGEWRKAKHVTAEHRDYPREWRRVCSVDWGFVKPGSCGWWVLTPEGHAYREDEYLFTRTIASDVAKEIRRRSKARGIKVSYTVGDTQMWSPDGQTGETIAETFARHGVPMIQAQKDRVSGWQRFRHWLQDSPDGTPWLQSSPNCAYFNRTIPALVSDAHKPEDVNSDSEDHAADEARYFVMSRPPIATAPGAPAVKAGSLAWWKRLQTDRPGVLARRSA
jgi:terminase large subunit-like protein